jgi:adenine-specific DNA-methyltransferase
MEDARRMVAAMGDADPAITLSSIGRRLHGWDVDPFACWLSQLAVEAVLLPQITASGRRLPEITVCRDSLRANLSEYSGTFELVNENPPFGKVKDTPSLRAKYSRSLKGHPNAYGMFTDLSLHLAKQDGGIVALLTPTSWLAGSYFSALRETIFAEARPASIALVESRRTSFEDVLQEVSLSCFVRGRSQDRAECSVIHVDGETMRRFSTGILILPANPKEPWLLPRQPDHQALVASMRSMRCRLRDYGYSVSTGPLVWNRAAKLGRMLYEDGPERVPVVWSEAVSQDGRFIGLAPRKRNHAPYYQPKGVNDANLVSRGCILAQRTTAKEQHRRLISAILPQCVIDAAGGRVAIENHLNMILPTNSHPAVPLHVLSNFLATKTADLVLRCMNASVAVSASELEALPLPEPDELMSAMTSPQPEAAIRRIYGMLDG